MPIQYKAVERINPTKPTDPKKFYATVTGRQPVDLKTIAQSISDTSTTSTTSATSMFMPY